MRQHRTHQGTRIRHMRPGATLREAWTVWLESARAGTIRTRSGDPYKPSALRSYDAGMEARVLPVFERTKVSTLELRDLQDLADQLVVDGHDPSTIRNTFMGLRLSTAAQSLAATLRRTRLPDCSFRRFGESVTELRR